MATHPARSMEARLDAARTALERAREIEAIATRLARVGYGAARLGEGDALVATVVRAVDEAERATAAQRAATAALRRQRAQLDRATRDALQLARVTLGADHPWLEQAHDPESTGASLDALLARAGRLFDAAAEAPPTVAAALGGVGLGPDAIRLAQGLIAGLRRAEIERDRLQTTARDAVRARTHAFERLDTWMRDFSTVARVALRDRPDLLHALEIRPRGRPRKEP